jgi:hypothetical protein
LLMREVVACSRERHTDLRLTPIIRTQHDPITFETGSLKPPYTSVVC